MDTLITSNQFQFNSNTMETKVKNFTTLKHKYHIEHVRGGKTIWEETFENLVPTVGLNYYLDAALKTGIASPLFSVGLKGTGAAVVGDTMAAHANWTDEVPYSNGTRPPWTPGAISAGTIDNSASKAGFNINATGTIFGAFLVGPSGPGTVKSGANGTLVGVGDFSQFRIVLSGDTLNVTISAILQ